MTEEYFIEKLGGGESNFNLWLKDHCRYYNLGTLFYQDSTLGNQWTRTQAKNALSYDEEEIESELESSLKFIAKNEAEKILSLSNPKEVAEALQEFF